jgi:hypothetical protein
LCIKLGLKSLELGLVGLELDLLSLELGLLSFELGLLSLELDLKLTVFDLEGFVGPEHLQQIFLCTQLIFQSSGGNLLQLITSAFGWSGHCDGRVDKTM